MPRFFFDIHDGEDFTPDRQGLELDGLEAAKAEAKKTLPEIVKDEMPDGDRRDFTVDVKSAAGQIVWRVTLSLVVESPSQSSATKPDREPGIAHKTLYGRRPRPAKS
jgi:hypothetical protein